VRLALVTQDNLPDWEVDDGPLHNALVAQGFELSQPAWSDPTVAWSSFDVVWIRTTWDYTEHIDAFLAWAERVDGVTTLVNPLPVVRWNVRKGYLFDLEAQGLPLAPTQRVSSPHEVAQALARWGVTRGFLKPLVGQTARATLRFHADEVAAVAAHLAAWPGESFLLQPYIDAVETEGEVSVLCVEGQALHGVRKVPVPGDYRVQDDFGASDAPLPLTPELVDLAQRALAAAAHCVGFEGPLLYGRLDLLPWQGGWVVNELELVEPSLFLRHGPQTAQALAHAAARRWLGREARGET